MRLDDSTNPQGWDFDNNTMSWSKNDAELQLPNGNMDPNANTHKQSRTVARATSAHTESKRQTQVGVGRARCRSTQEGRFRASHVSSLLGWSGMNIGCTINTTRGMRQEARARQRKHPLLCQSGCGTSYGRSGLRIAGTGGASSIILWSSTSRCTTKGAKHKEQMLEGARPASRHAEMCGTTTSRRHRSKTKRVDASFTS